jgi:hypothetical protein
MGTLDLRGVSTYKPAESEANPTAIHHGHDFPDARRILIVTRVAGGC